MLQRAENMAERVDSLITFLGSEGTERKAPQANPKEPDDYPINWAHVTEDDTTSIVNALEEKFKEMNWPIPGPTPEGKPRTFIPYAPPKNKQVTVAIPISKA